MAIRRKEQSLIRVSGQLIRFFSDLESVALAIEGSDLKDNLVPTANCIRDTKERQLVTRSGLQMTTLFVHAISTTSGQ